MAKTMVAALVTFGSSLSLTPVAHAASVWDRVAACESGGNWSINTGNGFYGGLQFTSQTWLGFGGGQFASRADLASKGAQITVARRTLRVQGPGAWPVCSVKAGLTRANGGSGRIVVSRSFNRTTIHRGQLAVDGIVGPLTRAAIARHGIHLSTKAAIRAWQGRLHVSKDGIVGPITARALQRWLNTH